MATKAGPTEKQLTQARDAAVACCGGGERLGHTLAIEWNECQLRIRDGVDTVVSIDAFEAAIEPALLEFLRAGNALRRVLDSDLLEAVTKACHDLPLVTAHGETYTTHLEATLRLECVAWGTFLFVLGRGYAGIEPALIRLVDKARTEGVDGYDEPQEVDACTHDAWRFEYYTRLLDGVKERRWFITPDGWFAGLDKEWSRAVAALPEPAKEVAPMTPDGNAVFRIEGETVFLRFADKEHRLSVTKGARRVHEILSARGADLRCNSVVEGHDVTLDAKARRETKSRIEDIDAALQTDALPLETREELEAERDRLKALFKPSGRAAKALSNAQTREADAHRRNVSNFFVSIQAAMPELAAHLKQSLALGLMSAYRPYPPVDWEL